MALKDVLAAFTAQATAVGLSEEGYYNRAVRQAQAGDTTDLDAINAEASSQSDTDAQTEIALALSDASSVSGGGGGLSVVTTDPVSPSLNDTWILRTPASDPTYLRLQDNGYGGMSAVYGIGQPMVPSIIEVIVPTPTLADSLALGGGVDVVRITWSGLPGNPLAVGLGPNPGQVLLDWDTLGSATVQDIVDELNSYSQAQIGKNWASVGSSVLAGDDFATALSPTYYQSEAFFEDDRTNESAALKLQGDSGIFSVALT